MATPRLFLDASVILAGIGSRTGASHIVLVLAEIGLLDAVVSPYVVEEVSRNVTKLSSQAVPRFQALLQNMQWEMTSDPDDEAVKLWLPLIRAKDAPVLAAAVQAQVLGLVTLDAKDFLRNPEVAIKSGLRILTPGALLRDIHAALEAGLSQIP